jgi:hypothetical protein
MFMMSWAFFLQRVTYWRLWEYIFSEKQSNHKACYNLHHNWMQKLNLWKNLLINFLSWLVVTFKFNAITINVLTSTEQAACVALAGDELEENMHMISLLLKARVGVGKGRESTQFNKFGLLAWTRVRVFVV